MFKGECGMVISLKKSTCRATSPSAILHLSRERDYPERMADDIDNRGSWGSRLTYKCSPHCQVCHLA
nr:hypothetical protein CFP56_36468 [Quercus suber]